MKKMKMILMAGSMLALVNVNAQAAQTAYEESLTSGIPCEEPKDCAEMGYTANAADCIGPALKCPWDLTKAMCKTTEFPLAVLYGDGSVAKKVLLGKTPIGIVVDEEKRIALALTAAKKDGTPGGEAMNFSDVDIDTPVENCASDSDSSCLYDGRKDTDIFLKETSGTYYAAQAANKYEPAGCTAAFCKKGKWFLPTIKDLGYGLLRDKGSIVAATLGFEWPSVWYWTSTEGNTYNYVWHRDLYGDTLSTRKKSNNMYYVKPAIKY